MTTRIGRQVAIRALLLAAVAVAARADVARVPAPELLATIEDDDPVRLPRSLAAGEAVPSTNWIDALAVAPVGAIHTPPEHSKNLGLLIRWGSFNDVLTAMTMAITTGDPGRASTTSTTGDTSTWSATAP